MRLYRALERVIQGCIGPTTPHTKNHFFPYLRMFLGGSEGIFCVWTISGEVFGTCLGCISEDFERVSASLREGV